MEDSLGSDPFSEEDMDKLLDDLADDDDDDGLSRQNPKSPQSSKTPSGVSDNFKSPAKPAIKSPKSPDVTSVAATKETPKKVTFSGSAENDKGGGAAGKTDDRNSTSTESSAGRSKDPRNTPSPKLDFSGTISGSPSASGFSKGQSPPNAKKPVENMNGRRSKGIDVFDDADVFGDLGKSEKTTKSSYLDSILLGDKKEKSPLTSKSKAFSFDEKAFSFDEKPKISEGPQKSEFSPSNKKSASKPGKSDDLDFSSFSTFTNSEDGQGGNISRRGRRGKPSTATSKKPPFFLDDSDITGVRNDANVAPTAGESDPDTGKASRGSGNAQPGLTQGGQPGPGSAGAGVAPTVVTAMPLLYSVGGLTASFEAQAHQQDQFLQQQHMTASQLQLQLRQLEHQYTQQAQQQSVMTEQLSKQREDTIRQLQSTLLNISNCSLPGQPGPPDPSFTSAPTSGTNSESAAANSSANARNPGVNAEAATSNKELDELVLKAQSEVQKLSAELQVVQEQHDQKIAFLTKSYEDKLALSAELHEQKEKLLKQQTDQLVQHHKRILELQQEQHEQQLQEMRRMKDMEVSAVERRAARNTEASSVVQQLNSNTAQLSELSSAVQQQGDAAQQVLQRALDAQKQQVSNLEAQLAESKKTADAEQERLRVLVRRLEDRLTNDQAAMEETTWRLQRKEAQLQEDVASWQKKKEADQQNIAAATAKLEQQQKLLGEKMIKLKVQESMLAVERQQKNEASIKPKTDKDVQEGVFEERLRVLNAEKKKILLLKDELSSQQSQLLKFKEGIEKDKFEVTRSEHNLQSKLQMLQQEQLSLALQRKEHLAAAASLQQRMAQIHAATEAAHVVKLNAAKERDQAEAALRKQREHATRGLCVRCGRPLVGTMKYSSVHSAAPLEGMISTLDSRANGAADSLNNAMNLDGITNTANWSRDPLSHVIATSIPDVAAPLQPSGAEVDYRPEAVMARLNARRAQDDLARP